MARIGHRSHGYVDREDAGRALGRALSDYAHRDDVVVLGLPRGGIPVAAQVARALHCPLDVLPVRKLGLPGQPELAMGAIASAAGTLEIFGNESVLASAAVSAATFERVRLEELTELRRREKAYRGDRPALQIRDRIVVIVDDGIATGSTMAAAVAAVRRQQPARLVVAAPVAAADTCEDLRAEVDEVRCIWTPAHFAAVGQAYRNFEPTTDEEVRRLLEVLAE